MMGTNVVRPIVEASVAGLLAVGVFVDNAVDIYQQATGPGVIFGAEAAWQWGLVVVAGGLLWRASSLVSRIDSTLSNFADKNEAAAKRQSEIDGRLIERIEANEKRWRNWEPVLIEWKIRSKIEKRDEA